MTYTPTVSGLYILTVNSAAGNTGTYTLDISTVVTPGPTGQAIKGEVLTVGDLSELTMLLGETPTYSYQWLRDGVEISGSTRTTYTLVDADLNKRISTRTTYTFSGQTRTVFSQETSVVIQEVFKLFGNITRGNYAVFINNPHLFLAGVHNRGSYLRIHGG